MIILKVTKPIITNDVIVATKTTWKLFGLPVVTKVIYPPTKEQAEAMIKKVGACEWLSNP